MSWERTTHPCHLPPSRSVLLMGRGVGSVWVCEDNDETGEPCGRRWRVAEFVKDRVRWELLPKTPEGIAVHMAAGSSEVTARSAAQRLRL